MSQQINSLPINGFTIADLALLAPGPGQFLEVGGATEGRIDIDALAAYCLEGLPPTLNPGVTGLAILGTETQAEARTAIGSPAFAGDGTATITTNSVVRSQIDSSGNVSSTIPGGSTLLPEFKCRAWVNFDGATTPPTIRASGNISSVARASPGFYTVNLIAAMPDENYAVTCTMNSGGAVYSDHTSIDSYTSSSFRIVCGANGGSANSVFSNVSIFR